VDCSPPSIVYMLTWKGGVQGFRLIIVGIALTAMLNAFNTWLILRADLELAMAAATWGAGTLNGMGMVDYRSRCCRHRSSWGWPADSSRVTSGTLELGDDTSKALGVRNEPVRAALIVVAVALVAVVTAAAGPIAFVALAAPQIGRRLAKAQGTSLLASAAVGALLLVAADLIAQHAFGDLQLPVGVITVSIGGIYLIWLLIQEARKA
jgi:iron complex transport system permease protein